MVPMLAAETKRFFDYITFDKGGTFQDLLTTPVGFVNRDLAPIYGLHAASYGTDLTQVNLDPAQRPGVFTRAGFLTAYSSVRPARRRFCAAPSSRRRCCARQIGDAADNAVPQHAAAARRARTNRERVDRADGGRRVRRLPPHGHQPDRLHDGGFDSIGAWQTTEKGTGAAIDSDGRRLRSARRSCTSPAPPT